jgi:hypothetical protein
MPNCATDIDTRSGLGGCSLAKPFGTKIDFDGGSLGSIANGTLRERFWWWDSSGFGMMFERLKYKHTQIVKP